MKQEDAQEKVMTQFPLVFSKAGDEGGKPHSGPMEKQDWEIIKECKPGCHGSVYILENRCLPSRDPNRMCIKKVQSEAETAEEYAKYEKFSQEMKNNCYLLQLF